MAGSSRPHPKNVPGDFYVEDGCCTACGIPEAEAPDHFTFDDDHHCYVKRQPSTPQETDRVLQAISAVELNCIRYRGSDPAIFVRLGAMGEPALCDFPPAEGVPVILRNHVAFVSIDRRPVAIDQIVADFRSFWMQGRTQEFHGLQRRLRGPRRGLWRREAWFEIAWHEDRYHRISLSHIDQDRSRVLMFHSPRETITSRGISSTLEEWLVQSSCFGEQQWFTAEEWARRIGGSPTPW